jgi:hypothetical protein
MAYNLKVLLDEVIKEYGYNKGYIKPNIRWSNFNRLYSFGEYRYWDNTIEISHSLNDKKINVETLKSVIYHEYLHQEYQEHNRDFNMREDLFPNVRKHKEVLEKFFDDIEDLPPREVKLTLDYKEDLVFCILNGVKIEEYLLALYACNGNYYINLGKNVKPPFKDSITSYDVIWLVEGEDLYYLAGISKDVKFLDTKKTVSLNPFYSDKFSYQATASIENTSLFMDIGCTIPHNLLPEEKDSGIFLLKDIKDFSAKDVINYINSYDFDLHEVGFANNALYSTAPLIEDDYEKLIKLAYKEKNTMRTIWIANKAKLEKECFDTKFCLADSLLKGLQFDASLNEYLDLQKISPENKEINCRIKNLKRILTSLNE